jgi:hypothetical protein
MLNQLASWVRLDFCPQHRQPSAGRLALATIASIVGSLAADALLVVIGKAIFPGTKGFAHFQFSDYAKLTVVGVIIACVAWPVVTRVSSAPRWLFFRLAILVTLVLWLPDLWILHVGESAQGVAVLMVMHLAIAVVTYNLLVRLAPVRPVAGGSPAGSPPSRRSAPAGSVAPSSVPASPVPPERDTPVTKQAIRGRHRHVR